MQPPSWWRSFVERASLVLPDADHPAAYQPTPYGMNRYALLLIYVVCTLATSCVYFGWGALSSMLFKSHIYARQCTEDETRAAPTDSAACVLQDIAVQSLFTICYASHFIVSAAAGILVDLAGPKVTALLGQALNVCGWALLGCCSDDFHGEVPAFVLIGAGSDMSYLPMLCIINLFPGSTGFALSALGASSSLSFAVPLVLRAVHSAGVSFRSVCWGYALLGPVSCIFLVAFFVPLNGFIEVDLFVLVRSSPGARVSIRCKSTSKRGISRMLTFHTTSRANGSFPLPLETPSRPWRPADEGQLSCVTDDDYFQPFRVEACTFLYVAICIYFIICSLAINFYEKAASKFLKPAVYVALDAATPLSTIPCLILGRLADFFPIVPIMIFVNTTGLLSFMFALFDRVTSDWMSILFYSLYVSTFTSQVYIFIKHLFTSVHFGKLIGFASMLGGVFSLVSSALYNGLTMKLLKEDALPVMLGLLLTIAAAYLLLIPMYFQARKKEKKIHSQEVLGCDGVSNGSTPAALSAFPCHTGSRSLSLRAFEGCAA
ncbi:hypothetical protein Esti_002700 [Eimeria stiedai]